PPSWPSRSALPCRACATTDTLPPARKCRIRRARRPAPCAPSVAAVPCSTAARQCGRERTSISSLIALRFSPFECARSSASIVLVSRYSRAGLNLDYSLRQRLQCCHPERSDRNEFPTLFLCGSGGRGVEGSAFVSGPALRMTAQTDLSPPKAFTVPSTTLPAP